MDISGLVRSLLPQLLGGLSDADPPDPLLLFARLVAAPAFVPAPFTALGPACVEGVSAQTRAVYPHLALACSLRMLPRLPHGLRQQTATALGAAAKLTVESAKQLLARRPLPVEVLWHYWLLVLARSQLRVEVPEFLLKALWQRAWTGRRPEGPLHAAAPDAALDVVTYYDLCAVHAAYNAVLLARDFDLFPPVQQLVDWHVGNTQPDHITTEPWGLAAFASLDGTGTFAAQQLHDTTAHATARGATPVLAALLADALVSQEEAAGV